MLALLTTFVLAMQKLRTLCPGTTQLLQSMQQCLHQAVLRMLNHNAVHKLGNKLTTIYAC